MNKSTKQKDSFAKEFQRKRLNKINPLKCDEKIKQKVPDFSGKYHGKINNNMSRKSDVK